ncbi:MAG: response regulator [Candidatus Margulisbacteria bacterium]|nr:response regulator [Candidatus Margulisiibacteriota bacterium]
MAKILIIEDEKEHIFMFRKRFEPMGYDIVEAHNGKEGIEKVKQEKPDLIFLDLVMPVMNGIEVCKALRDDPETKDVPIIVVSAVGEFELAQECLRAGANDFVRKPFEAKELIKKVNKLIKQGK